MRPIIELRAAVIAALDTEYTEDAIRDLGSAVRNNVEDAVNEALEGSGYLQTCLNCQHFAEPTELCMKADTPQRPPARVIAFGCPAFEEELTPVEPLPVVTLKPVPRPSTGFDDMDDDIPF